MRYTVKSVVCDYGVFGKTDNEEKLIDICNSKSNAELIADILNTDLKNERYEVVKKSKVDKALEEMEKHINNSKLPTVNRYNTYSEGLKDSLEILKRNIGE